MKPNYDDKLLREWWNDRFDLDYDHAPDSWKLRMSKTLSFQVFCLNKIFEDARRKILKAFGL